MKMIQCNPDPQEQYYQLIDRPGHEIIVLGELEEQWTKEVLAFLSRQGIHAQFLPWSSLVDVRLSSELTRYPVLQYWSDRKLVSELIGYHIDSLRKFADRYFHDFPQKRGRYSYEYSD